MFIEGRPVSLGFPESPCVVVCFSLLTDGEGSLGLNRNTGSISARFLDISKQLILEGGCFAQLVNGGVDFL